MSMVTGDNLSNLVTAIASAVGNSPTQVTRLDTQEA